MCINQSYINEKVNKKVRRKLEIEKKLPETAMPY